MVLTKTIGKRSVSISKIMRTFSKMLIIFRKYVTRFGKFRLFLVNSEESAHFLKILRKSRLFCNVCSQFSDFAWFSGFIAFILHFSIFPTFSSDLSKNTATCTNILLYNQIPMFLYCVSFVHSHTFSFGFVGKCNTRQHFHAVLLKCATHDRILWF